MDEEKAVKYLKELGYVIQPPTQCWISVHTYGCSHHYEALKNKPKKGSKHTKFCKIDLKNAKWETYEEK